MKTITEADQVVHKVENQWHYSIMTRHGYTPIDKEQKGFVRRYKYENAKGKTVVVSTGVHCDYWSAEDGSGYWGTLEAYLNTINKRNMICQPPKTT